MILGAEKELSRYIITGKAGDFRDSLDSIRKLGIVSTRVDTANFASHIDARFPKTSATESAKDEITRSMSTGNIANIYYDGKGEKYTLMDRNGKTSKEVYMSPPHVRIMRNGLTLEQEVPKKK